MTEKELFESALRAVNRSYSYEEMLYGDALRLQNVLNTKENLIIII